MLKVRVLFTYSCGDELNSNLFELIHLNKNMKRSERSDALTFENSLSASTKE